jgi:hypothetical protein
MTGEFQSNDFIFDQAKIDGAANIFQKALAHPSVATFEHLLNDPRASITRALT